MSEDKVFNQTIIVGRLVGDAESFQHQEIKALDFSIAHNEWYLSDGTKKKRTDFFDVVAWENQCELVNLKPEEFKKGLLVSITGKLKTETWMGGPDKKEKRTRVKIVALQITKTAKESGE